jgi:hypothetical protein
MAGGRAGGLARGTLANATDIGKPPAPAFLSLPASAFLPVCLSSAWHFLWQHSSDSTPLLHSLDGTPRAPCPQTCGQRHFGVHRLNCDFCDQRRAEQRGGAERSSPCTYITPVPQGQSESLPPVAASLDWTPPTPHPLDIPTPHCPVRQSTEVNSSVNLQLVAVAAVAAGAAGARKPALPACARHYGHCWPPRAAMASAAPSPSQSPPTLLYTYAMGCPHYRNRRAHPFHPPKAAARAGRHAGPSSRVGQIFSRS